MKKTDDEIIKRIKHEDRALESFRIYDDKFERLGHKLALLSVYNYGKLQGIRQERKRRRKNDSR